MPADVYSVPFDSLQYCVELQDSIESAELHHHTTICFQRYLNIESDELITNHVFKCVATLGYTVCVPVRLVVPF